MSEPGDKISKSFCILPWIHLYVGPNGNTYPCCIVDWRENIGNVKDSTLKEIWNNNSMKGIRKEMIEGTQPNLCRKCYQQETHGLASPRVTANRNFREHIDRVKNTTTAEGENKEFKLIYWDFRFSNLCNFKCRTCSAGLSSKWYEDEIKLYGGSTVDRAHINVNDYSKENIQEYVDEFIGEVEEIYFAGGEPLIMDEHYLVLQKLIDTGNTDVKLRYNTNLSRLSFKNWNVLELWKNFTKHKPENVDIYASLDGIGNVAEFSRSGTNWAKIEDNIKICLNSNIRFNISCTVSILNILNIPAFVDRLVELGVNFYHIGLYNILTYPHHYHINILPEKLKHLVVKKLDEHLESMSEDMKNDFIPKYKSITNYLYSKPAESIETSHKLLKTYTLRLDKIRKESFVGTYPEYKNWIESI